MLKGTSVIVRPVLEADLQFVQDRIQDIESRGPWYPRPRRSLVKFRKRFEEDGLWGSEAGLFVIEVDGRMVGHVSWGLLGGDIPDMELGYLVYATQDRGKGYATEALVLTTRYLFDTEPMNRASLAIHFDNVGSQRVGEKAGFVREVRAREAWEHLGIWHDIYVYNVTRREFDERWPRDPSAGTNSTDRLPPSEAKGGPEK